MTSKISMLIRTASVFACGIVAMILMYAALGRTQTVYGSIVGTVTDSSGSAIPNVKVTLTNTGTNERREIAADSTGNYQFLNLLPGEYQVEAELTGFKRFVRSQIAVQVQEAVRIDPRMEVGDTTQTLQVTEQTPLLQTQDATLGQVVESSQVQNLALNGRNVLKRGGLSGTTRRAIVLRERSTSIPASRRKCRWLLDLHRVHRKIPVTASLHGCSAIHRQEARKARRCRQAFSIIVAFTSMTRGA